MLRVVVALAVDEEKKSEKKFKGKRMSKKSVR